jgi:hypothetical protein
VGAQRIFHQVTGGHCCADEPGRPDE